MEIPVQFEMEPIALDVYEIETKTMLFMAKYAEKHNKFVESFRNFISLVRDKKHIYYIRTQF